MPIHFSEEDYRRMADKKKGDRIGVRKDKPAPCSQPVLVERPKKKELKLKAGEVATGYVYFIEAAGLIKIGYSIDPDERTKTLETMSPVPLTLLGYIPGTKAFEQRLHRYFASMRSHGEWFRAADVLKQYIAEADLECRGIPRLDPAKRMPPSPAPPPETRFKNRVFEADV